jgi:enterochelin esterase-like enzyme
VAKVVLRSDARAKGEVIRMRTLTVAGAAICLLVLVRESTGGMHAQTTPPQSAPPTSQGDGRGRGPQGPPLLPTPPLTAPPTPDTDGNFVIGPPYTPAPELTVKEGVPQGKIHEFTMDSKDSKIYPGIARSQPGAVVPYTRQVAVYVPAQYVAGTPAPFIVAQDGMSAHYRGNLPPILDNLIHEKRVPPIVAVMVHNGGGDAQGSQRGLEYDTVSGVYTDFIETEVLPRITRDYGIVFTRDPEGRATMGGSSGAACAFTMAWFHPELYRKVLSYSGTYVNQQSPLNPESPRGAWEYHATFIPSSPAKPIRVWMHVSERDNRYTDQEDTWHNWVLANERMAAALKAKGYKYQYVYSQDSRHVDRAVVAQTLPEALEWLWKGYAPGVRP